MREAERLTENNHFDVTHTAQTVYGVPHVANVLTNFKILHLDEQFTLADQCTVCSAAFQIEQLEEIAKSTGIPGESFGSKKAFSLGFQA